MEFSWELVEKGRAGVVTLIGMGGVFTALIFLYIFTSVLGRFGRHHPAAGSSAIPEPGPPENSPAAGESEEGEALAAAVAVSLALAEQARTPRAAFVRPRTGAGVNPWKLAGRRTLMRQPVSGKPNRR